MNRMHTLTVACLAMLANQAHAQQTADFRFTGTLRSSQGPLAPQLGTMVAGLVTLQFNASPYNKIYYTGRDRYGADITYKDQGFAIDAVTDGGFVAGTHTGPASTVATNEDIMYDALFGPSQAGLVLSTYDDGKIRRGLSIYSFSGYGEQSDGVANFVDWTPANDPGGAILIQFYNYRTQEYSQAIYNLTSYQYVPSP